MTRGRSPTNLAANWQFMRGCQLPAACLAVCQSVSLRQLQPDGKIWIAIAKCGTGFRFRTGSIRRVRVRVRGDTFDDMWKLGRDFDLPTSLVDWFMCHINKHTHTSAHSHILAHTLAHSLGNLSMFIMESDIKCCCFYCCCWPINCSAQQIGNLSTGVCSSVLWCGKG